MYEMLPILFFVPAAFFLGVLLSWRYIKSGSSQQELTAMNFEAYKAKEANERQIRTGW